MPSYNCDELHLNLPDNQKQVLRDIYKSFAQRIDNNKVVEPALINKMSQALETALTTHKPWQSALTDAKAFRHSLLHLLHTDSDMLALPWHIVPYNNRFMHLSKGFNTEGDVKIFEPEKALPLKILIVIAMPDDLEEKERLNHETEVEKIINAFDTILADAQVEIDFTNDGTLLTLKEKLAQNAYHILHFSGHGILSKTSDMGYLLMEDDVTFKSRYVKATEFAEVLSLVPENRPELVVLSACQSAKGFDSVTRFLHNAGVPSVVSMNQSILDYYATFFAAALYKNIAQHLKSREPLSHSFALAIDALREEEEQQKSQRGQYLIPQLFTSYHIQSLLNYEQKEKHALKFNAVKFVTGEKRMLLEKQEGYTFVGRRREIRLAMPILQVNKAVLLRGQGGVGKTALAEYLIGRLLLNDSKMYPFMLDEKKTNIEDLSNAMIEFLDKDLRKFFIRNKVKEIEKATDKFWYLMEMICEANRFPIFIFDNLESFQEGIGGHFQEKHHDLRDLISDIIERGFPVILTSRYPVPDFQTVQAINLNEMAFGDFYRKAQNLRFYELRHKLDTEGYVIERRLSHGGANKADFKQVVKVLHNTLGGNTRALEFFDAIYHTDSRIAYETFEKLDAFSSQLKEDVAKVREQLQTNAKSLVFEQLLAFLIPSELRILQLLEPFRVPVFAEAIAMQDSNISNIEINLKRLFDLTLIEQHEIGTDKTKAYFVAPLVCDYLNEVQLVEINFNHKQAGEYFDKRFDTTQNIDDAEEAYYNYYIARDKAVVNKYGAILCRHYFGAQIFQKSYNVGKQTEDFVGIDTMGDILNYLGQILKLYGQLDVALTYYERNLIQYRAIGDKKNEGITLNNISLIYSAKGDYDTALQYLKQSLDIKQQIEDPSGESRTLNNISQIYQARGHYELALRYLEQSLAIQQQIDDLSGKDVILSNISHIYSAKGDHNTALHYLEQSLAIRQQIGDRLGEGVTLNSIAGIAIDKGDYNSALRYLEQSLTIKQQIGDRSGEATTLNNISRIYSAKGDYDTALHYLEQSLTIAQQIGDRSGEGRTMNNIGVIYDDKGDYDTALRYLEQSLVIAQQIDNRRGEGKTLNNISRIYSAKKDYDTALRYLEQSLFIEQQIDDLAGFAGTLHNMGIIFWEQKQEAWSAVAYFMQAYKIFTQINSPTASITERWLNRIKGEIGEAQFDAIIKEKDVGNEKDLKPLSNAAIKPSFGSKIKTFFKR